MYTICIALDLGLIEPYANNQRDLLVMVQKAAHKTAASIGLEYIPLSPRFSPAISLTLRPKRVTFPLTVAPRVLMSYLELHFVTHVQPQKGTERAYDSAIRTNTKPRTLNHVTLRVIVTQWTSELVLRAGGRQGFRVRVSLFSKILQQKKKRFSAYRVWSLGGGCFGHLRYAASFRSHKLYKAIPIKSVAVTLVFETLDCEVFLDSGPSPLGQVSLLSFEASPELAGFTTGVRSHEAVETRTLHLASFLSRIWVSGCS